MIRRLIALFVVALALAYAGASEAATLYITEFASPISNWQTQQAQNLGQPSITTQTVAIGASSVQSSTFNTNTHGIQVYCDTGCSIAVGTNPTASLTTQVLTANQPQTFTVGSGQKIAVIANTSGTPSGGGGGGGGAVTVADGADVTQGAIADTAASPGGTGTVSAKLREISSQLSTGISISGGSVGLLGGTSTIGTVNILAASSSLSAGAGTDGWNLTEGTKADAACGTATGTCSLVALAKYLNSTAVQTGIPGTPNITTVVSVQGESSMTPLLEKPAYSASSADGIAPKLAGSAASSLVLKAGAGNLYSVYATCTTACWLMVFNATAAPSNGATTAGIASGNMQDCVPIPANAVGTVDYKAGPPEVFTVGMTAAISSTACATLTLSTVGFINGRVQ